MLGNFGKRPDGSQNDGINLAVPQGTEVRAAEGGRVAYAGSELKGYGNLVLIRHEGGWVTAYAHSEEMLVKRDDVVRRGQVSHAPARPAPSTSRRCTSSCARAPSRSTRCPTWNATELSPAIGASSAGCAGAPQLPFDHRADAMPGRAMAAPGQLPLRTRSYCGG